MIKHADLDHPVHELIATRWSPYAFSDRSVALSDLNSLFEAARWAASSYNEQPWSFPMATREVADEFARVLSCQVESNNACGNSYLGVVGELRRYMSPREASEIVTSSACRNHPG